MSAESANYLDEPKGYFSTETEETHALAGQGPDATPLVAASQGAAPADPNDSDGLRELTNPKLREMIEQRGRVALVEGKFERANKDELLRVLRL